MCAKIHSDLNCGYVDIEMPVVCKLFDHPLSITFWSLPVLYTIKKPNLMMHIQDAISSADEYKL